ncbi:sensor histidine kinase [Caulobacter mirabilis]|uniref:histidine kinase n=1 Tax=Caulobacter mirabilis TaxID=69666 RepID=A0A2D2ASR3_9CAUL|nr:histidine kinase [Caulobacter mirabilis]ATQ41044.1 hypothetical protein CSW64_00785 [Caulobacter mirabilis]
MAPSAALPEPNPSAVPAFYQATLDALPSCVALIDSVGDIIAVNAAWRRFGEENGLADPAHGVGRNYLEICETARHPDGAAVAAGLRALLAGAPGPFRHEYECPSPAGAAWGRLSALRLEPPGLPAPCVMILHDDVTARREAERGLREIAAGLLLAEDAERRRIGRELHDGVAQQLTAARLMLGRFAANDGDPATGPLAEAANVLSAAIVELRTLSYLLHPPMLEPLGLAAALRQYAGGFSRRTGVAVTLDIETPFPRLSAAMEIALYRMAQEALDNVHRHSGSRRAEVALAVDHGLVRMTVRDYGAGLADGSEAGGAGLQGMRLRLQELGGGFRLADARPGLVVAAELPAPSSLFHSAS